ncbi:MAG TPA: hypothetical protein VIJ58_04560 [Candidatus Dormibacteraeota bacterium]
MTEGQLTDKKPEQVVRDRAIWVVRLAAFGGAAGALGLSWLFGGLAEAYFSGKSPTALAPSAPAEVPVEGAPVQQPPTVVQQVVRHPYGSQAPAAAGSAPRAPGQAPAPALAPPPAPVCNSTPSKPC